MKKISKKTRKKLILKYELSFLLPSFAFMVNQYEAALNSGSDENEDYMLLIVSIIKKLQIVMSSYKSLHLEIIDTFNAIIDEVNKESDRANKYFLVGLSLILFHRELKMKQIPVSVHEEASALIDMFVSEDSSDNVIANEEYTSAIVEKLKKQYFEC